MNNGKLMYDAWFNDILDDVRDNVVGEYYHTYLNYKYYREILKDLLHHTKLVYKHNYPTNGPVAHFNYGNDYELESPSNTINHIEKYSVPENELNDLHTLYYFILKQIVKTQGEENILTESLSTDVNGIVDKVFKNNPNLFKSDVYTIFRKKYKMNKQDADEAMVIYLSKKQSLREQHYEDWDERSKEQNINLLKAKGIDILSTDPNVPFYRRIDSKEIRFLNKVATMLVKETKLEESDDISDFIVYAPFGSYELKVLLNERIHYGFEKYVNNIYGVGDNQIIFPTHNSISQAREGQFLWEMYKDKLRRKQIQMVNPGWDIPDDAIIIEQDLSDEQLKSLDKSFEYMDIPQEMAAEELGELITWVKDLPEILFLYRVLYLDDKNQINYDELGSHYSQDRTDLINNHYDRGSIYGHAEGEDAYLITVKVPKSEVDVMETLNNNILYPHEKEITLKDKGRAAQYLDVEKI